MGRGCGGRGYGGGVGRYGVCGVGGWGKGWCSSKVGWRAGEWLLQVRATAKGTTVTTKPTQTNNHQTNDNNKLHRCPSHTHTTIGTPTGPA